MLAFKADGDHEDPRASARPLGDHITPTRPGLFMDALNAVSRDVGSDVADWSADRILRMIGTLEREHEQRGG